MIDKYITIALSVAAFSFSIYSFIRTFQQKTVAENYNLRKTLSDIVSELIEVNLELNRLQLEQLDRPNSDLEPRFNMRRNYIARRRYLANQGEIVFKQISALTTDVDCMVLAAAFGSVEDRRRAKCLYQQGVDKSPTNVLKMLNLGGFGIYWFAQRDAAQGREKFEKAVKQQLPDTDNAHQYKAELCVQWAKLELEHGDSEEARRILALSRNAAARIANTTTREYIEALFKDRAFNDLGDVKGEPLR